jgi:carbamoyltransferase
MKILSFKLSHDGTLALVEGNKLIFSYEMEKLNNRDRIIDFDLDFNEVQGILTEYGYTFDAIDEIVMDGWTSDDSVNKGVFKNAEILPNTFVDIELEKYGHFLSKNENMLSSKQFKLDILDIPYSSYMHTSGHLYSAYCTSPFAKRKEDTFVLIWDGGMFPHLFYYKYKENTSEYLGFLFPIGSSVYTGIAHLYSPFNQGIRHHYSVPGKYMAYTAVGNCDDKIMEELEAVFNKFRAGINEELLNTHKELSDTGEDFIEW